VSDPVKIRPEAGGEVVESAEDAAVLNKIFGGQEVSPEFDRAEATRVDRRAAFDTLEDKVLTLGEGILDAGTLGIVRERGEEADIRRDVNAGSAFVGNLVGSFLPGSPVGTVTRAGERMGKAAARAVIKDAERSVIARGIQEAGGGMALMGAWSTGHQAMDAIIEDKEFSAEAVLDEVKIAGALGFVAGGIAGSVSRVRASRSNVTAQGGLVGGTTEVRGTYREALKAWDGVLDEHSARYGAIKEMRREGLLNPFTDDLMPQREAALSKARAARRKLDGFDPDGIWDADPSVYRKFQAARDEYVGALSELDDAFRPRGIERQPFITPGEAPTLINTPRAPRFYDELVTHVDEAPTGSKVTPTSENKTGMQRPGRDTINEGTAVGETPAYRDPHQAKTMAGETPAFREGGYVPRSQRATIQGEAPPELLAELLPERTRMDFGLGRQMLPEHLEQITRGAKILHPKASNLEAGDMLHGEVVEWPLLKLPNGYFMPQATIDANAAWFHSKFPGVVDPAALRQAERAMAPHTAKTQVGGPALRVQQVGGLPELDAAIARLPEPNVRPKPSDHTLLEEVPAAQINAAEDRAAAQAARAAAREAKQVARLEEKAAKAAAKEAKVQDKAVRKASEETTGIYGEPTVYDIAPDLKRAEAQRMMDEWIGSYQRVRPSPADVAATKVRGLMDELKTISGGRLDSASGIRFAEREGVAPSPLFGELDQVWAMRRVAKLTADQARGVKTGLLDGVKGDLAALGVGAMFGEPLLALAAKYVGFGGKVATAAGALAKMTAGAAEKFLTVNRVRVVAAAARNNAWSYSDRGPIKDPVERIEEIRRMASDPATVEQRVRESVGDLAMVHPEWAQTITIKTQMQLAALAQIAPQIAYDPMGRPLNPPAGEMRKFLEFENAIHDVKGILNSVAAGSASPEQIKALQIAWPSVHAKLVGAVLSSPEAVQRLSRARLRAVEALTGVPLTPSSADPTFVQRQAEAWVPPQPQQPPGRPQAFKINPEGPQTPAQSSARAPGN
jgi:hypothetical protein